MATKTKAEKEFSKLLRKAKKLKLNFDKDTVTTKELAVLIDAELKLIDEQEKLAKAEQEKLDAEKEALEAENNGSDEENNDDSSDNNSDDDSDNVVSGYKVVAGKYIADGKTYRVGDVVESDIDLVKLFPGKFSK